MTLSNTAIRYGTVTKSFHWLTALLILGMIPLGLVADEWPYDTASQLAQKAWLFSLHKTLGVTLFFVAVARILWAFSQTKPGLLHPDRKLESWAAETVHWLLYGSLVIMPLSGWIGHAASEGFAPIWWPLGQSLPLVPKSEGLSHLMSSLHIVFSRVLIAALLLHIAGALKHHVIDKDATLRRMWFGRSDVHIDDARHSVLVPLISAACVFAAAIGAGLVLNATGDTEERPRAAQLEAVQSDWQVQDGTLEITVTQFGSKVTGSFADWTADISFDDSIDTGKVGDVTVTVAIASLTLGTVTSQAMGPNFFAAETYPTATFQADLQHAPDGYEAVGTLTMKGQSMPLTLPFTLALDGDTAVMEARTTLDRRSYNIGETMMNDEKSLAFDVALTVNLTATRAAPPQ